MLGCSMQLTFLMFGQAEVDVPTGNQNHVVLEIFALNLRLLHYDNVCLEYVEHGLRGLEGGAPKDGRAHAHLERPLFSPWLIRKRVSREKMREAAEGYLLSLLT